MGRVSGRPAGPLGRRVADCSRRRDKGTSGSGCRAELLGTLVLLVIILVILGASRKWFTVNRRDEGAQTEVQVLINREKIREDTRSAAEIARGLGENVEQRFHQRGESRAIDSVE